jgi:puromycin-sensitive aminopeptidase
VPKRYELSFVVEPARSEFSGAVTTHIEIHESTQLIILHAVDLNISRAVLSTGQLQMEGIITPDPGSETVVLDFKERLCSGPAKLLMTFEGRLNQQMKGLYEARAGEERYAFTQFEATDARRAFPCFDEPGFKAVFHIIVEIPADLVAVSNMEVETLSDAGGARKRVTFKETPPMSTYLVALAVARLVSKELVIEGTKVAIYSRPELSGLTGFAGDVMNACLPMLNEYFGLHYPISKLDLLGVPDFAMGAMENWGAIFFRENRLLADVSMASTQTLRAIANVITHEVVHQWFGNLVTMWWWDDLWLNESFATWLACKIVDDWRPEWQSWVEFAKDKQVPLGVDALQSTRPISSKVRTAAEAEEMFDALTYEKGASVLRMLEQFLGEKIFRDGIRSYITAHQYGNAAAAELWAALEQASGQPVRAIAADWFSRPGFPMLAVEARDGDHGRLLIRQRRFFADPAASEDPGHWKIPMSFSYEDDAGMQRHRVLMSASEVEVKLPAQGPVRWAYANAQEQGYYRTQYDQSLRHALAKAIARLSAEERFGLLDNAWALAQKGELAIAEFLDLVRRLRGDGTRIVIEALAGYLEVINDRVVADTDRPRFARFVADLLDPLAAALGWDARAGEGDEAKLTRAALLWALGSIAKPAELLQDIATRLERYWANPKSLDPTLVMPVMRLGARSGNHERYERYLKQYREAVRPEERDRYLVALGDFIQPELITRILALVLTDEIRAQDIWKTMRVLLANPAAQAETWAFIKANWAALRKKGGSVGAQRILGGTKTLWREEWLQEVQDFFSRPENHVASAERVLAQTVEVLRLGLGFRRLQQKPLGAWLGSNYP